MYTPEEIRAERLDDFRVFLHQIWKFLELPNPTRVQNDIARTLQYGPRRLIVEAFRGVGKSWITTAFVLWCLFLNPQQKIEVISASGSLADDFTKFAKQLITGMPLLNHLKALPGQRDKSISFDVGPARESKDPSVKSIGITGQITGTRADLIVADDIEVPKNSYTHHLREKLAKEVKEFDSILKPGGRILYLGTPHTEESLYNVLGKRGYTTRIWPAEIPKSVDSYNGNLAPLISYLMDQGMKPGDPVDPNRFDKLDLEERRLSNGRSGYALQFMLDTNLSSLETHPLKLQDLMVMDVDPELAHVKLVWGRDRDASLEDLPAGGFDGDVYKRPVYKSDEMARYAGTVMALDPSGTGRDETAYAIIRFAHGNLYLVDVGGFKDGFAEDTLRAISAAAARHGVNHWIDEPNYGGGMFAQLLKPHMQKVKGGTRDDEFVKAHGWARGQKELRILDTLEPVVQSHRLVVDRRVIEKDLEVQGRDDTMKYSLIHQFSRITRDRGALANDDRLEAVAMAVNYWTEKMARDKDRELDRHKEALLDEELKKFKEHAVTLGMRPSNRKRGFQRIDT